MFPFTYRPDGTNGAVAAFVSSSALPVGKIDLLTVFFDSAYHLFGLFGWNQTFHSLKVFLTRNSARKVPSDLADGVEAPAPIGFRQFTDSAIDLFLNGCVRLSTSLSSQVIVP